MSKVKVGIVGYGNLGKACEEHVLKNDDMELVCIVSRRTNINTKSKVPVIHPDEVESLRDKIDVMILCGGSATDLPEMTPAYTKWFNTVDSYDNHSQIPEHYSKVDSVANASGYISIISVGWDPGMFSLNRLLSECILPEGKSYTFYGPGVSQGHSDAVRRIDGVADARQYTIPIDDAVSRVRNGETPDFTKRDMHVRDCYVVAKPDADKEKIAETIVSMPGYFVDYNTNVNFISQEELNEKHNKLPHGGFIIRSGVTGNENKQIIEYSLKLDSNPEFTSAVLVCYARAAYRLHKQGAKGCHTVFDVAPALLSTKTKEQLLKDML